MTQPHTPRPADLVALVSFDGEVFENQAVTRERLGKPHPAPHPLAATMQHWLGIGRRVWIDVDGRQIQGIATARELANHDAWEIDTLVDASSGDGPGIAEGLLRQAADAAADANVGRILLRLRHDAPALRGALRAGFMKALDEQLWAGPSTASSSGSDGEAWRAHGAAGVHVREARPEDAHPEFQLYSRTLPVDARAALGMTFDEWAAAQERRWVGRGGRDYVALDGEQLRGALRAGSAQFTMLVEPGAEDAATALLRAAAAHLEGSDQILALLPACVAPVAALRMHGLEQEAAYILLALRTQATVREEAREAVRVTGSVVPTGG
jgi:hypothetical protein